MDVVVARDHGSEGRRDHARRHPALVAAPVPGCTGSMTQVRSEHARSANTFAAEPPRASAVRRVTLHRVRLPLRQLYVSSKYVMNEVFRTVIEVETDDGCVGVGEAP